MLISQDFHSQVLETTTMGEGQRCKEADIKHSVGLGREGSTETQFRANRFPHFSLKTVEFY